MSKNFQVLMKDKRFKKIRDIKLSKIKAFPPHIDIIKMMRNKNKEKFLKSNQKNKIYI